MRLLLDAGALLAVERGDREVSRLGFDGGAASAERWFRHASSGRRVPDGAVPRTTRARAAVRELEALVLIGRSTPRMQRRVSALTEAL